MFNKNFDSKKALEIEISQLRNEMVRFQGSIKTEPDAIHPIPNYENYLKQVKQINHENMRRLFVLEQEKIKLEISMFNDDLISSYSFLEIIKSFTNKKEQLVQPPATKIVFILKFIFNKKIFETIYSQVILDAREEYFDALQNGYIWLSRWRHLQIYTNIVNTIFSHVIVSIGKKLSSMWKLL